MIITAKPFDQMTLAELCHERAYWDEILANATGWGSARQIAIDFQIACDAMIARRVNEPQTRETRHGETSTASMDARPALATRG